MRCFSATLASGSSHSLSPRRHYSHIERGASAALRRPEGLRGETAALLSSRRTPPLASCLRGMHTRRHRTPLSLPFAPLCNASLGSFLPSPPGVASLASPPFEERGSDVCRTLLPPAPSASSSPAGPSGLASNSLPETPASESSLRPAPPPLRKPARRRLAGRCKSRILTLFAKWRNRL